MKILIVSLFSDNFGDPLIRICFAHLLKAVLKNLKKDVDSFSFRYMSFKEPDEDLIRESDLIFFAGGGVIGFSYLDLFAPLAHIIEIADEKQIPVVFSSVGLNNIDTEDAQESEKKLSELFEKSCVKAISVRDHLDEFRRFTAGASCEAEPVCDPVVWARPIFHEDLKPVLEEKKRRTEKVVGINVVRGGLFHANGVEWSIEQEQAYLEELEKRFEDAGLQCVFYTNGGYLDERVIRQFCKKPEITQDAQDGAEAEPAGRERRQEEVISSRKLVTTIASFDAVAAFRMHSAIVSYALGIPSVNIVWNEKISSFYSDIGHPERAVEPKEDLAETISQKTIALLKEGANEPDPEYLMTLYRFLYRAVAKLLDAQTEPENMWNYEQVVQELEKQTVDVQEDLLDYQIKIRNEAKGSLNLLERLTDQRTKIEHLREEKHQLSEKLHEQKEKTKEAKEKAREAKEQTREAKEKTKEAKQKAKEYKEELDRLNGLLAVKVYKKLKK